MSDREIAPQYVDCRTWQHNWKPTDVEIDGPVYIQHFRCLRKCGVTRHMRISRSTGRIMAGGGYTYPEDYRVEGGTLTADERGQVRLRAVKHD